MNETQRRIKAYKEALPGLRERVVAVALLLVMSAAMMTSASFAWLTISRRPELTGVNTTVAANGNLEIALVSPDGNRPAESKVGDSSATKGQSIAMSNITWGNLVNLSDPSYGLENLTLRPAQLNTASLLESPLYGAMYGQDGRITQLSSNFGYATWKLAEGDKPAHFAVSDQYGVRAIASTMIKAVGAEATYYNMTQTAKNNNLGAANMYVALGNDDRYMPSLATMMGLYMTARMNPDNASLSNPTVDIKDIQNLRDMYADFLKCFDEEANAMAALVNLQLFLLEGEGFTAYTAADIYATTTAALNAKGLHITDLDQFKKDRNTIAADLEKLRDICSSGQSLTWKDTGLNQIVNNLVNVGECTIGADNTPISSIGASNAMGYLKGTQEARITNGILYRFEERTGGYIEVQGLSISATVERGLTIPATVKANIKTTASRDYSLFNNDLIRTQGMNQGFKGGVPVAEDTYGLAIDLWVRTNAAASYLTLEGNVLTESNMVRATGTDANGNTVELYTATISGEDEEGGTVSFSIDLYKGKLQVVDENNNTSEVEAWFNAETHAVVTEEELGESIPAAKMTEVITVIGFEGENRIWQNNSLLSTDATTQGSGSCYVYYADTPEDQARSLRLLEAFNVAFVDEEGKLLATAVMDTERFYAVNGRVVVPLVMSPSNSINLGEDSQGNVIYAITTLEQNVPTRITAIVYLDGTKLSNQEVLAAADIQGQLNIQFGSTEALNPLTNEKLETATRTVSATVSPDTFDYDTATTPMTTRVKVHVDGEQPNQITAFFLRSINATQGSREAMMTFTQQADGDWVADHTFTAPGTYILRTVRLDGVDYDLPNTQTNPLPKVTVTGFSIEYLNCTQSNENNHVSVMSAASASTVNLSMKFVADEADKLPETVVGRYLRDDGSAVNVTFTLDPTTQIWTGEATFVTSGNYTLRYLVLDGEYTELDPGFWQTANVTLGMRVAAYTTSPHRFKYTPSEMTDNQKFLGMQVMIVDNSGKEMPGLTGAKLVYSMKGSSAKTMDTDLTWNGSYYVGELKALEAGPGIWQFSSVTVSGNTLTYATQSPTFTIQSPEPPVYFGNITSIYQFSRENKADMRVQITNSSTASVQALIRNTDTGKETWVTGTVGTGYTSEDGELYNEWIFPVPKTDINGNFCIPQHGDTCDCTQDGNWKMMELKMWDVFAADGTAYTEEEPLIFDEEVERDNVVTKAVATIYVTIAEDKSANFGKDADGNVTGKFMDTYTVSGLNVDIKDFEGEPIYAEKDGVVLLSIKNATLKYTYGNNSKDYGGYESPSLDNSVADFSVTMTADDTGTHFVQTENKTIQYAGSYAPSFSFVLSQSGKDDLTVNYTPKNMPTFTVSSAKPTVKITSVDPASTTTEYRYYTSNPAETNSTNTIRVTGTLNNKVDDYNAALYIYCLTDDSGRDGQVMIPYLPTIDLELTGVPNSITSASISFGNASNSSYARTFTFSNMKVNDAQIGGKTNGAYDGDYSFDVKTYPGVYPAGEQTVTSITVVYGGFTFVVDLSHAVTINQPIYPAYLSYSVSGNGFNGSVPATQYSPDGKSFEVVLPSVPNWTQTSTSDSESNKSGYTNLTDTKVSKSAAGICNGKDGYYNYTRHQRKYTVDVTTTTKTITYAVTGWKIDGVTYKPGDKVVITKGQTAVAVIEQVDVKTSSTKVNYTVIETYDENNIDDSTDAKGTVVDTIYESWTETSRKKT